MRRLATLFLGLGALGMTASAAYTIDFSGAGAGSGTISGGVTTSTGTSILIDTLLAVSTPLHNGTTSAITGGTLSYSATGGSYSGGVYTYTGGTFSISGTDATAGATGTLISGTLSSLVVSFTGAFADITVLSGPNTINASLVSYFGLPSNAGTVTGGTVHLANVTGGTGGTYSATTFSTDIPDNVVPEPTSVLLLGTVMFGVAYVIRRRGMNV